MQIIDAATTASLAEPVLADLVAQGKTFTPWDVTQLLRTAHPDTFIEHVFMKRIVRDYMFNVPDYNAEVRAYADPQGNPVAAVTFFPATVVGTPAAVPQTPPAPASGPAAPVTVVIWDI